MTGGDDGDGGDGTVDACTESATVLVVDDETTVLNSFEQALSAGGYDVVTAGNGGEALARLDGSIDVVLLDRRMPGMSGDEVLEHIQEWRTDCMVVLVTAVDPDADVVDMPFDDYLVKPVTPSELVETVEQLLLFDRYEELLTEYHMTTRKYATLAAASFEAGFGNDEAVESLADERDAIRAELEATIEQFSDETVREALLRAHGELA